ncbi:hypothetical protein BJY21_002467 [Kineosphaera limosa]|uniref:General stress protein 17M-like domain-containing protein n=1 Tax=Kineosphaera limosa NBRC 100340 TaxID=1184609 RepID=K6XAT2_9MICO|nr:general stress protein [Kineosphaera limosa]NYE01283.1 hypothetical protein [Kineosphaera limosa]GAB95919.1 hypothetical protein KILIM_029_00290 [Kineosphaera limosa NBRC 100340]
MAATPHADAHTIAPTTNVPTTDAPTDGSNVVIITTYPTYEQAQRAVDRLSDEKFDVAAVKIVGQGLRSVEQVTGRMTKGRAALYGMGSGAWFGLFIGLLFGLFLPAAGWLSMILTAVLIGGVWGAIFGFFGHLATGGQRDFTSVRSLRAEFYELKVRSDLAADAARLLGI